MYVKGIVRQSPKIPEFAIRNRVTTKIRNLRCVIVETTGTQVLLREKAPQLSLRHNKSPTLSSRWGICFENLSVLNASLLSSTPRQGRASGETRVFPDPLSSRIHPRPARRGGEFCACFKENLL